MTREELTRENVIKYLQTYSKCKGCTDICYDRYRGNKCKIYAIREDIDFEDIIEYIIEALSEPKGRLIDADALLNETVKKNSVWNSITNANGETLEQIVNRLQSEPTTITENMTNGDVINAMFPNAEIYPFYTNTTELIVDINLDKRDASIRCTEDWLNKPYYRNEIIDKHFGKE